jgi:hypothetical protein
VGVSRTVRSVLGRLLLAGALSGAMVLAFTATALGAGKPINVGTPFESGAPAVAVDASGTAYVVWANTKDLAGASNFVQYCVLPVGAVACTHSGNLVPAGSAAFIDNVQVLDDGGTIVVLADVFGAATTGFEPEQEWQSSDGGATFSQQAGGNSVSTGILDADTEPLSAVIVPGTNLLGYGWNTAGGSPPTFNAFPLSSPPVCSEATNGCAAGFASLEPNTNPDQIGNAGGQFASQLGTNPGVMGVFNTDFTNGPLGCSNAQTVPFGTAFAYAAGSQSASNNYNISPGSPNSAWRVAVTQADCNVEFPAVDGGPSGFGIIEDNELTGETVYHRFDQATQSFDTPKVTIAKEGELSPAVSQDGAGGVYATYIAGSGRPVRLAFSINGGTSWSGPATLDANTSTGISNLTSDVNSTGQGWAAWTDNGSVYAQPFTAADSVVPPSIGGAGTATSTSVTLTITCASTPCTVTVTITIDPVVTASTAKKKNKPHHTTITLATGRFTIRSKGSKKLKVGLSKAGRKFLATHHGSLKATVLISEKTKSGAVLATRTIKIRITAGNHKK